MWALLEAIEKESVVVVMKKFNSSITHERRTAAWEGIARAVNTIREQSTNSGPSGKEMG